MWLNYIPEGITTMLGYDLLLSFLKKFDKDINEGELLPDKWIAWGSVSCGEKAVRGVDNEGYVYYTAVAIKHRYFFVRLPSYQWGYWNYRRVQGWLQAVIIYDFGKWKLEWLPCRQ